MRELERDYPTPAAHDVPAWTGSLAVVGHGRAGGSISKAASAAGLECQLVGRDLLLDGIPDMLLLCVPDREIAPVASELLNRAGDFAVGHVSGATGLDALSVLADAGHSTFSMHPLQTIASPDTDLTGAPCAIAASHPETLPRARHLASTLGMRPFEVPETSRAAYHAAASMASNFLVALEEAAAEALAAAGVANPREILAPLVLRSAANWVDNGPAALTGPIARGDETTVAKHLEALAEVASELVPLYEVLAERTRAIGEVS